MAPVVKRQHFCTLKRIRLISGDRIPRGLFGSPSYGGAKHEPWLRQNGEKKTAKKHASWFPCFFYVFFKLCFIYCILFFAFNGYIRFAPLKRTESLPSKEPWYLKKVQTPCSLPGKNPASRPLGICSWDGMSLRLIYAEYGRLKMYTVRKVYVIDMYKYICRMTVYI